MNAIIDYRFILVMGGLEASFCALGSPMTQGVFAPWVRVVSFALGAAFAAVLKLVVVLSRRKASTDPIGDDALALGAGK